MPLPADLDMDKVIAAVRADFTAAARKWAKGAPHAELAPLNRLTERLNRTRGDCDIGLTKPPIMTTTRHHLHQRGDSNKDALGADLAATVQAGTDFNKTALFRLKIGHGPTVLLNADDLKADKEEVGIRDRSFIRAEKPPAKVWLEARIIPPRPKRASLS